MTKTEYINKLIEYCQNCNNPAVFNGLTQALELAEKLDDTTNNSGNAAYDRQGKSDSASNPITP